jgi:hypothetical protein
MKTSTIVPSLALAALALGAGSATAGEATVTFIHPEKFADMPRSAAERETVLKSVADHFIKLARTGLPADATLKVEVLDIDLAGRIVPSFRWPGSDIRVLHGAADWPHMALRYTVTRAGQVLASGEDNLTNLDYLHHVGHYFDDDPLRYEKTMIDDWFKKQLRVAAG